MRLAHKIRDWRDELPHFARHEGVWEGVYRYYDDTGTRRDEHRSRLICRFPASGPYPYHQTNFYTWADGRTEVRDFPALIRDGRLIWQGGAIEGWAAEVPLDQFGRTSMLYWVRRNEPTVHLYEMIQLSDDGRHRSRVWQWFRGGRLFGRTLIDEQKTAEDWSGYPV